VSQFEQGQWDSRSNAEIENSQGVWGGYIMSIRWICATESRSIALIAVVSILMLTVVPSLAGEDEATPSAALARRFVTIDVPGAARTVCRAINESRQIVGWYQLPGEMTSHGFLLKRGVFRTINAPHGTSTLASGINNRGQIVGTYDDGGMGHGFLLDRGRFTTIDAPGATAPYGTQAYGINDSGQIVGLYTTSGGTHGFLWDRGSFTTIDVPGAMATLARGINNHGQIVGRYLDTSSVNHFFCWIEGLLRPLMGQVTFSYSMSMPSTTAGPFAVRTIAPELRSSKIHFKWVSIKLTVISHAMSLYNSRAWRVAFTVA
jgi:probable HAF family extracellular repeat protein